jgi:hypothetical protein
MRAHLFMRLRPWWLRHKADLWHNPHSPVRNPFITRLLSWLAPHPFVATRAVTDMGNIIKIEASDCF